MSVAWMTGNTGHSQLCVKPRVVDLCKRHHRPQRVSLHLALICHIPEHGCLPGTCLGEISWYAEEEKFAETKSSGSARTRCFIPKICCFTGVLSQAGAPAVSQVGSGCKTGALGRAGHQREGWEQLLTSASRVVSADWLTKPPFEGEYFKSGDTSCCSVLSKWVGFW